MAIASLNDTSLQSHSIVGYNSRFYAVLPTYLVILPNVNDTAVASFPTEAAASTTEVNGSKATKLNEECLF